MSNSSHAHAYGAFTCLVSFRTSHRFAYPSPTICYRGFIVQTHALEQKLFNIFS